MVGNPSPNREQDSLEQVPPSSGTRRGDPFLDVLLTRSSVKRLGRPGPTGDDLENIIRAGLRAPDHGRLRPWRFLVVQGAGRRHLADLLAGSKTRAAPDRAPDEVFAKVRQELVAVPLVVVVCAVVDVTARIRPIEQILSAGAAAENMLLAAHALGYAGIWLTGSPAYDGKVKAAFGLRPTDAIVGFLYIGTAMAPQGTRHMPEIGKYAHEWPGTIAGSQERRGTAS